VHLLQQAPEDGPVEFRTTGGFLHDLLTARLPELVDLKIQIPIARGDAGVAVFNARSLAKPPLGEINRLCFAKPVFYTAPSAGVRTRMPPGGGLD
jgi:hypothetical protein